MVLLCGVGHGNCVWWCQPQRKETTDPLFVRDWVRGDETQLGKQVQVIAIALCSTYQGLSVVVESLDAFNRGTMCTQGEDS